MLKQLLTCGFCIETFSDYNNFVLIHKGSFTNYVYKILLFFDHLPPSVYIFYDIKVYKKSLFLTTYPPPLVNVVCEWPLSVKDTYGQKNRIDI